MCIINYIKTQLFKTLVISNPSQVKLQGNLEFAMFKLALSVSVSGSSVCGGIDRRLMMISQSSFNLQDKYTLYRYTDYQHSTLGIIELKEMLININQR